MVKTYSIAGSGQGILSTLFRTVVLGIVAVGSFLLVTLSAAFAMLVAIGLLILGTIVFGVFWLRAKILGRPMMPYSHVHMRFKERGFRTDTSAEDDSIIIDAHETPDGWSVDKS